MKFRIIVFASLFLPLSMAAKANDDHLIYFQKLNQDNIIQAKKDFTTALSASDNIAQNLFFKAGLAYLTWNNHEKGSGEIIEWCKNQAEKQSDILSSELLDTYLVLAQYELTTYRDLSAAEKYLIRSNIILSRFYDKDNFRNGIYYFLKGLFYTQKYDHVNAIQLLNRSITFSKTRIELEDYLYRSKLCLLDAMTKLRYYEETLRTADVYIAECKDGTSTAAYYQKKGYIYNLLNDTLHSIENYQKGLGKASDKTSLQSSVKSLILYKLGGCTKGSRQEEYFRAALRSAESFTSNEWLLYQIMRQISLEYYYKKDYINCLKYAQRSLIAGSYHFTDTNYFHNPALQQFKPFYDLIEVLGLKGNAFIRLNPKYDKVTKTFTYYNLDHSIESLELATALTERYLMNVNEENSGLSITEDHKRILNNITVYATMAYEQTHDMQYAYHAFNASERNKMQFLRVRLSQKENLKTVNVPDTLIDQLEYLNRLVLNQENMVIRAEKKGKYDIDQLRADLTVLYDKRDLLNYWLSEHYPMYKANYHPEITSVRQIQQFLQNDQVLLEYSLTVQEIIIYAITKDSFSIRPLLLDDQFLKEIENLRKAIYENPMNSAMNPINQFCQSSGYLYDYLVKPVYGMLKGKRLIIVPHNELTLIPFEVLIPVSKGKPVSKDFRSLPYLIRDFPISYAYSATFLLEKEKNQTNHAKGIGIFVPDYNQMHADTVFADLSGARYEAKLINRLLDSRLFQGNRANEYEFKKHASQFSILHIASHTIIDEAHPGLSCMVLHDNFEHKEDGYLYAYELSEMKLNARLVMLSGCNTGFGMLRLSEGLVSIARSFFYTGVRTVGFTLWNVADQAGAKITQRFYQGLRDHQTLDVAMRNSKLEFLKNSDPVKASPFFWANYLIVGNTDKISVRRLPRTVTIAGIFVIVALIAAFYLYRKGIRKKV